jgi:hypothetical protein
MVLLYFLINLIPGIMLADISSLLRLKHVLRKKHGLSLRIPDNPFTLLLRKFGCNERKDIVFYTLYASVSPLICMAVVFTAGLVPGMAIFLCSVSVFFILLQGKKARLGGLFQKNAYRIYRYILNQVTAGVAPREAIESMYEIVEDKELKEIMIKVCGIYSVSLNAKNAGEYLAGYVDSDEGRGFASFLEDELLEARDHQVLARLETLMFNRYFSYIQKRTDSIKTKCTLAVVLLSAIVVIMILIPLYMDIQDALNNIFIS